MNEMPVCEPQSGGQMAGMEAISRQLAFILALEVCQYDWSSNMHVLALI